MINYPTDWNSFLEEIDDKVEDNSYLTVPGKSSHRTSMADNAASFVVMCINKANYEIVYRSYLGEVLTAEEREAICTKYKYIGKYDRETIEKINIQLQDTFWRAVACGLVGTNCNTYKREC